MYNGKQCSFKHTGVNPLPLQELCWTLARAAQVVLIDAITIVELLEPDIIYSYFSFTEEQLKAFKDIITIFDKARVLSPMLRKKLEEARPYFETLPSNHWEN